MRNVLSWCSHIRIRNLNLIEEDVLDRVRNIDSLHFTANIDIEGSLGSNWQWLRIGLGRFRCLSNMASRASRWNGRWSRSHLDLSRLRMHLLPCGFKLWYHELSTDGRSLEHWGILADGVAHKFAVSSVIPWIDLIASHAKHIKVTVNVETIHLLKGIFAKLRYILLAHFTNLLRLLPTMPCVDNFRSPYCSDVNIVNIVGLAVIIHTATVKMQVKGSRLGIPMQGSNTHRIAEIGLDLLLKAFG